MGKLKQQVSHRRVADQTHVRHLMAFDASLPGKLVQQFGEGVVHRLRQRRQPVDVALGIIQAADDILAIPDLWVERPGGGQFFPAFQA